jgi:hypothetical protein
MNVHYAGDSNTKRHLNSGWIKNMYVHTCVFKDACFVKNSCLSWCNVFQLTLTTESKWTTNKQTDLNLLFLQQGMSSKLTRVNHIRRSQLEVTTMKQIKLVLSNKWQIFSSPLGLLSTGTNIQTCIVLCSNLTFT